MRSIQSEYLDILLPGFNSLAPEIKNQFENAEIWSNLNNLIATIKAESMTLSWWFILTINDNEVHKELEKIRASLEESFQPMLQAVQLERYPFLKFLVQQKHINLKDLTVQNLAKHINDLKAEYFRYRLASIPYLGAQDECLEHWNAYFVIDSRAIDSIEALHEYITICEVLILQNCLFNKMEAILGPFMQNKPELFNKINQLSQNLFQNPSSAAASLDSLIEWVKLQVENTLAYSPPSTEQATVTISDVFKNILGSLSKNIPNEVSEIADVHAIIQASGFSTQNEYSHLAILDFVNYVKYTEEIKNLKTISSAFIRPLLPLYWELVYVSKQPKNLIHIIRLILPLVLLTGYLIAIETLFSTVPALIALLSILHAPEVAMILTMVISIYVGLVLISYAYENLKIAHQYLTNSYYGGQYETPVYQVNQRMENMFGTDLAQEIRAFYIDNMQKLDTEIQGLEHNKKHRGLDENELSQLKNSQDTRKKMELEWMGVHHLTSFSTTKAKEHVKVRLQEKIQEKYENFKAYKTQDLDKLSDALTQSLSTTNASISLFQPQCLAIKNEIEGLVIKARRLQT